MDNSALARTIDHTLLKPAATAAEILQLCEEALEWSFYSACVNSAWISLAKERLANTPVKVVSVAGFPLGASSALAKCREVETAVGMGADEIDFVNNTGLLKDRSLAQIRAEFCDLVKAAQGCPLKVIIEASLLTDEEKTVVCELACEAGIAFVKTSTGFVGSGATVEDVLLMKRVVGDRARVKASAGIRDRDMAVRLLEAGADRLGTSAGVAIMEKSSVRSGQSY